MSSLLKKLVIILSAVVFILFIAFLIAAWKMGMFAPVTISDQLRGPYYVVTLPHTGPYQGINEKMNLVSNMLKKKQIKHSVACGIFFDDPSVDPVESLRSEGGFLVKDSVKVDSTFIIRKISKRLVVVATIEANPAVAGFKTYPALNNWIKTNSYQRDSSRPIIELYHPDEIIDVELPIIHTKRD